ncbi:hypothetical protein ACUNV4_03365 [Granulosicoccus sp. 3-233]|uniref:hypothetical protein n=1 Tax=Granulosicoccus sp. 3-233 TaxID=3417969 RepID=UPI003D328F92
MSEDEGKMPDQGLPSDDDGQDIGAMLDAGNEVVPHSLNQQILSAAREAIANESTADSVTTPLPTEVTQLQPRRSANHRWQTRNRWIAMAASVILAVTVVPLMLRSPDSSLDNSAELASQKMLQRSIAISLDSAADGLEVDESQSLTSFVRESMPSTNPSTDSSASTSSAPIARSSSPRLQTPEASPVVPAIRAQKRSAPADAAAGPATDLAADSDERSSADKSTGDSDFRKTPDSWVARIRQLQKDGRYDEAIEEYELFRGRYPNHEPELSAPRRP